ncbi:DUF1345 domain-containing protein [Mycobacterium sp. CVI_P3]|uniref:DUF1345 domain-containing protein n=1 Tax=Mycobacterium pinniadriaticum TaxID=2994102 RepID=A0ABT3SFJ1_9MYCO|nr:DUF1345 domain-containing protein [Mycobacterium pinniadriaticum]MCX2931475.1 DUF1345 domain-containing protein [Mycobacterium pinniadriaticum]MCX2937899.1 DUF1345 domain-containing protein [Mycobacterium pinniadriaticum]
MADTAHGKLPFWKGPAARVTVGVAVGAVVTALLWRDNGVLSLLGGCTALAMIFTAWTWLALWSFDSVETQRHAEQEQPLPAVVTTLVLGTSVASLVGVGVLLARSQDVSKDVQHDSGAAWMAVGSVVLAWLTIHTLFALIYAKHYFDPQQPGGIDFNGREMPCYKDFFYVAFAVGMSFAISDTNLTSTRMRATVLGHGLLSFVFSAIILASVVNLIASGV